MLRRPDAAVADDHDRHLVPEGDPIHLVLHGTRIGIDEDAEVHQA
jgi:hypothetical protein